MVDEKYYDISKITDEILEFFVEERKKTASTFGLVIAMTPKLKQAGVLTIDEDLEGDDLEELEDEIVEHLVEEFLPKMAQKQKKVEKISVKQVIAEMFDILTIDGKGVIPLKNGKELNSSMLINRDFDVDNIDVDNLDLVKGKKPRFDLKEAEASLATAEGMGINEQSKFASKNIIKIINFLEELYLQKLREDDGIYFEFVDISLERVFSNKSMADMKNRDATYDYWREIGEKNNELIKKVEELVDLLKGDRSIEELKQELRKVIADKKENKDIAELDNIINFLETMENINKQKVYDKGKIIFNTKVDSIAGAPTEIKFNKLNYITDVDFSNITVDKINARAATFIKRFLYNQGFLNNLYDVSNVKMFSEIVTSKDTGEEIRVADLEEEPAETFEEYDKLEEALTKEVRLDPLGIVYVERDLDKLAGFYNDYKGTLLSKIRTQFRKFKKVLALEPEDFEDLQNKLENTVKVIRKVDEKRVHLPIFMFNEEPLKRYYKRASSLSSKIKENIFDFITAYRDLIQEEKTFSAQNIFILMVGLNKAPERPRPQERYIRRQPTRVGTTKIRKFRDEIKQKIDEINQLMLQVFIKPMHSIHRAGFTLPFEGNLQLRTIATLSEDVGDEFLAYKIMSDNLKELDYTFIEETQIRDILAFIKAINRGEMFDDPNNSKLREKAEKFSRAVVKAFGKNRTIRKRVNKEIASMFGAVQELSPTDKKIDDFLGFDVGEAFGEERVDDPDEIGALQVLMNAIKEKKETLVKGKGRSGMIDKNAINSLISELDKVMKSEIYSKILEAHDSLRILKGKPIYYAKRSENNFDHVESMLIKMQDEYNLDMSASELVSVVNDINSFDNISKSHGISNEHVYLIKANFR